VRNPDRTRVEKRDHSVDVDQIGASVTITVGLALFGTRTQPKKGVQMHSRVLTFTDAKNIEGGVDFLRQKVVPVLNDQKGYRGVTASADRSGGLVGILTLWETAADREASESALAKSRQEGLDIIGGKLSVELFEELLAEVADPPGPGSALMVTRISMDPAKIDDNFAFFKSTVLPRMKANAGFQSVRNMMDRKTGNGLVGTVWANQDAMKAAAADALSRREEGVARGVSFGDLSYREILFVDLR
jgi:heme-degrading monooxygenase HmoA